MSPMRSLLSKSIFAAIAIVVAATMTPTPSHADGTFSTKSLTPKTALKLATETMEACREMGYQVAVSVVNRSGIEQVMLRDRFAGPHTPETARRKAWSAVSFRTNTTDMLETTKEGNPQAGIRHLDNVAMLGGGMMINSAGELIGGIGVSGAPGGDADDACAIKGIEAIEDTLDF